VDADDVRVRDAPRRRGLVAEAVHRLGVRADVRRQQLERHRLVQLGVQRPVHRAHPAAADLFLDPVARAEVRQGLAEARQLPRGADALQRHAAQALLRVAEQPLDALVHVHLDRADDRLEVLHAASQLGVLAQHRLELPDQRRVCARKRPPILARLQQLQVRATQQGQRNEAEDHDDGDDPGQVVHGSLRPCRVYSKWASG
jgi:hypothetical protein